MKVWIQHRDYSYKDLDNPSIEEALNRLEITDWAHEAQREAEMQNLEKILALQALDSFTPLAPFFIYVQPGQVR